MVGGDSPFSTNEQLRRHLDDNYGLRRLNPEWISRQRASMQASLIRSICNVDIREISGGSLPWRPQDAHSVQLGVKVLVQIDEVVNVGAPDRKAATSRLLQFALTDGTVNFIAIELDPTKSSFSTGTVPGTKLVLLPSALVRRGRVVLTSADYTLLGAPQRSIRSAVNTDAVPRSAGLVGSRELTSSHTGGASRAHTSANNIPDVGGIAAVTEPSEEGADHDGLWGENRIPVSRYPAPVRERTTTNPFTMRTNESRMEVSVRRSPSNAQEPSNTKNYSFRKEVFANRNASTNRDGAERGMPRQTAQMPNEARRAVEAVNGDADSETQEPLESLERMNISDSRSQQLVRLSDLMNGENLLAAKPGLCRLYAIKTAKRMDDYLTRENGISAFVDDGSAVKIVTLSNKFVESLRNGCPTRNERYHQGADHDIRRSVRSICGFVQIECQNNVPVAKSLVSESPVSSAMISKFLEDVETRYKAYRAR